MRKSIGFAMATLVLAGCGQPVPDLYSEPPLIAAQAGTPALRAGLWRVVDPECDVDDAKPLGTWPDCARAVVVRGDAMLTRIGGDYFEQERFVLADGLPMILQVQAERSEGPREQRYYGVRPTTTGGEVIEMTRWRATCSPPRPVKTATDNATPGARDPRPGPAAVRGLTVDTDGRCVVRSADQLRAAVLASEDWDIDTQRLRWVRSAEL